jgi:hypothetical protein
MKRGVKKVQPYKKNKGKQMEGPKKLRNSKVVEMGMTMIRRRHGSMGAHGVASCGT